MVSGLAVAMWEPPSRVCFWPNAELRHFAGNDRFRCEADSQPCCIDSNATATPITFQRNRPLGEKNWLSKLFYAVFQGFCARLHCESSYLFDSDSDGKARLIEALRSSARKVTFERPGSGSFSVWQGICCEGSGPLPPQFFSGIAEEW